MNNFQMAYQLTIEFFQRNWKIISISILLYIFFLISNLPANQVIAWVKLNPNSGITLSSAQGSVWSGKIASITVRGISINNFEWNLNLFPLLYGNISIDFLFSDNDTHGKGELSLGMSSNKVVIENLEATLPISSLKPLMIGVPGSVAGQLSAHFDSIIYAPGEEIMAKGNLVWNSAVVTVMQTVQLGDLKLSLLPRDKGSHGVLKDAGGPLILEGTVQLSNKGQYQAAVKVGTRSTAEPALKQSMPFLGRVGTDGKVQIRRSGRLPL